MMGSNDPTATQANALGVFNVQGERAGEIANSLEQAYLADPEFAAYVDQAAAQGRTIEVETGTGIGGSRALVDGSKMFVDFADENRTYASAEGAAPFTAARIAVHEAWHTLTGIGHNGAGQMDPILAMTNRTADLAFGDMPDRIYY
ncbi:MAG: hypothetical protein LPL00_11175 [Alphaproteobacteria bacterium]|nr:hypothetical protein [Alphaproteobacteria bacterium]MDX5370267.1 hypothetical protein [Alphaproteobacteria bacterium]MDX5464809.1 hypothetical protein [Alphaproteobacteria bacterium]